MKAEGTHGTDEDSLESSDSSVSLICENSLCEVVGRSKRQRIGMEEECRNTRKRTR